MRRERIDHVVRVVSAAPGRWAAPAVKPGRWLALAALTLTLMLPAPAGASASPAVAAPSVTLAPSLPSGQLAGTSTVWHATASGLTNPVYQFSVAYGHGAFGVVRDFSPTPSFTWTPLHEGTYTVRAAVKAGFAATSSTQTVATSTYTITSRAPEAGAVVSRTANPLVALYSAPACAKGTVAVQFQPAAGSSGWQSTAAQPCSAGQSIDVLVAGLRPNTRYLLRHVVSDGSHSAASTTVSFTSGAPPAGLQITTFAVKQAPSAQADLSSPLIFHAFVPSPSPAFANPIATNLQGQLVWYYDTLRSGLTEIWPVHILPGGTVLLFGLDQYRTTGDDVLREVDLAGNVVRETNIDAVNAQLSLRGQEPIYMFHHDAIRLPNGDTAVLGATQDRYGGHNVMGDMVIVLDPNFQVTWTWDLFDYFTPPTKWPLGTSTCDATGKLCGLPDPKAVDWTHGNALDWSAQDGNLLVSFRDISLVIKIAYQNGRGNGKVVWRLGQGGDFPAPTSDPSPWFSGQHNANYVNSTTLVVFDDGNVRCQNGNAKGCQSRGQVWKLDEVHHTAVLLLNVNLGRFWQALGSAQGLPNGDYTFTGGFFPPSKVSEFSPNGTKVYELDTGVAEYRSYRLTGMLF